ncbi:centrosomal protein of 120 kDa-like [Onthophagus taurus]|uniref:centrosomal protein of 120 kDa-like n=1 Tax=Onthophagus taurus TaxID=166361 RepID=UPI0039BDE6B2
MNELRGKYVNLVLGIEEARNMDFLQHPLYILANFNGRTMESDLVNPCSYPDFNTELVWETEKKIIRNFRCENVPLRVECHTYNEKTLEKECFGFVLLSLRTAQIISSSSKSPEISLKWFKLIGVKSMFKKFNPELRLSLSLRDVVLNNLVPPAFKVFGTGLKTDRNKVHLHANTDFNLSDKEIVCLERDGYIKLGTEEENCIFFELNLLIKTIINLDLLLTPNEVFKPTKEDFFLSLKLFNIEVKTKSFEKTIHKEIFLNENVVVKFHANMDDLKRFFKQFNVVTIDFCLGSNILGASQIDLNDFIPNSLQIDTFLNDINGVLKKDLTCVFNPTKLKNKKGAEERQPKVLIEIILKDDPEKDDDKNNQKMDLIGSGDFINPKSVKASQTSLKSSFSHKTESLREQNSLKSLQSSLKSEINLIPQTSQDLKSLNKMEESSESAEYPQSTIELRQKVSKSFQISIEAPDNLILDDFKQFSLDIILQTLTLKHPEISPTLNFKFKHPKASTYVSYKSQISPNLTILDNINCKLVYVSTKTDIAELLKSWKPRILIEDDFGKGFCEEVLVEIEFDRIANFENTEKIVFDDLKVVELIRTGDLSPIGELKILIYLQECGFNFGIVDFELRPRILDEILVIKELNELMNWKDQIKAEFVKELKVKQKQEIGVLIKNWIEKKNELENKLIFNVNRCKKLAKELKKSSNKNKIENLLKLKQKSTSLENIHEEIRKNAVKYSLTDNYELIEKISNLELDNEHLKNILAERICEIDEIKKFSLSNEQTANLLQDVRNLEEKYMEVLKVKNYFKEQYAKSAKEIHELKEEGRRNITSQLMVKKEELSQLSLDKFFDMKSVDIVEFSERFLDGELENEAFDGENDNDKNFNNDGNTLNTSFD